MLLGNEFALDARQHFVEQHTATRKSVMWVRTGDHSLMAGNPARLEDYVTLLVNHEYSYLMRDGGVIQIAYTFERDRIERHRLAYYPCPFPITTRDINSYDGAPRAYYRCVYVKCRREPTLKITYSVRLCSQPGGGLSPSISPHGKRPFMPDTRSGTIAF